MAGKKTYEECQQFRSNYTDKQPLPHGCFFNNFVNLLWHNGLFVYLKNRSPIVTTINLVETVLGSKS